MARLFCIFCLKQFTKFGKISFGLCAPSRWTQPLPREIVDAPLIEQFFTFNTKLNVGIRDFTATKKLPPVGNLMITG